MKQMGNDNCHGSMRVMFAVRVDDQGLDQT